LNQSKALLQKTNHTIPITAAAATMPSEYCTKYGSTTAIYTNNNNNNNNDFQRGSESKDSMDYLSTATNTNQFFSESVSSSNRQSMPNVSSSNERFFDSDHLERQTLSKRELDLLRTDLEKAEHENNELKRFALTLALTLVSLNFKLG
jgi:hypothetical protein